MSERDRALASLACAVLLVAVLGAAIFGVIDAAVSS